MLKYEYNRGMRRCMFIGEEDCVRCDADVCIHAAKEEDE